MHVCIATSFLQNTMYTNVFVFSLKSSQNKENTLCKGEHIACVSVLYQVDLQINCSYINNFTCIFAFP